MIFHSVPDDGCNVYLSSLAPCSFASFCIDVSQNTFSESTLLWAYHVTVAVMVSWFGPCKLSLRNQSVISLSSISFDPQMTDFNFTVA